MQYFVGNVTAGLFKVLCVKFLYYGVFVTLSYRAVFIHFIDSSRTKSTGIDSLIEKLGRHDGLSAAVYASARTSHDLDERVVAFAVLDLFHNLSCLGKSVYGGNLNGFACQINCSFLYSLYAANSFEIELFKRFSGNDFVHGTKSRFHNAAGCTENKTGSGAVTDGIVKLFVGQIIEVDTVFLDKAGKFSRGKNDVDIRISACSLVVAKNFLLLCRTRHARNNVNILRIDVVCLGIIGLHYRTEHLLRRFAGRKMS